MRSSSVRFSKSVVNAVIFSRAVCNSVTVAADVSVCNFSEACDHVRTARRGSVVHRALTGELLLPCVEVQLIGFEGDEATQTQLGVERIAFGIPCPERFANRVAAESWCKRHGN